MLRKLRKLLGDQAQQSRFFHWLWRFNAIAIAGGAVLVGLFGIAGLGAIAFDVLKPRSVSSVARLDPAATSVPRLETETFSELGQSGLLWAPRVERDRASGHSYRGKSLSSIRNYVFYDPATGQSRDLLPDDKALIIQAAPHFRRSDTTRAAPVGLLVTLVRADSNGDGFLSARDDLSLLAARPDGSGLTDLEIVHVEGQGQFTAEDGTMLAIVEGADGQVDAVHVDPERMAVTARHTITKKLPADPPRT